MSPLNSVHNARPQTLLPGIERPKPLAEEGLPLLPMQRSHIALILAGHKVGTLRAQRLQPGTYRLAFARDHRGSGLTHATVEVATPTKTPWTKGIFWPSAIDLDTAEEFPRDEVHCLNSAERAALAAFEGYRSVEAFENFCQSMAGRRGWQHVGEFLRGERPLFFHWLKNPREVLQDFPGAGR